MMIFILFFLQSAFCFSPESQRGLKKIETKEFVASFTTEHEYRRLEELEAALKIKLEFAQKIILRRKLKHQTEHLVLFSQAIYDKKIQKLANWSYPNERWKGDPREDIVPNDPMWVQQLHLPLIHFSWSLLRPPYRPIILAITDDGIDLNHSDLKDNIWTNSQEIENGLDDDGNGYIDDLHGWNFSGHNNNVQAHSYHKHGTHVAGIAGASAQNLEGGLGVNPFVTILPLKIYGDRDEFDAATLAQTFQYALDQGAQIISTSYNIDDFVTNPIYLTAIKTVYEAQALLFNSAGNLSYHNPRRVRFEEILLVAATTTKTTAPDRRASYSNFGQGIDLCAPGDNILSTVTGNKYERKSGTSMAAPQAAALAALIWQKNPEYSRDQVAAQLLMTTDDLDQLNPRYRGQLGHGRINMKKALEQTPDLAMIRKIDWMTKDDHLFLNLELKGIFQASTLSKLDLFELSYSGADRKWKTADDEFLPLTLLSEYKIGTNTWKLQTEHRGEGLYRLKIKAGLRDVFLRLADLDQDGQSGGEMQSEFELE